MDEVFKEMNQEYLHVNKDVIHICGSSCGGLVAED